jgi:hypothetical protein
VTVDGVLIGNRIYWTLTLVTTNNYYNLTELHTPKITIRHKVFSVFTVRCLVGASNGGRPLPLGSRNIPGPNYQLQLSYSPGTDRTENVFHYCVFSLFRRNVSERCSLATAVYTAVTCQWVYMPQYIECNTNDFLPEILVPVRISTESKWPLVVRRAANTASVQTRDHCVDESNINIRMCDSNIFYSHILHVMLMYVEHRTASFITASISDSRPVNSELNKHDKTLSKLFTWSPSVNVSDDAVLQ